MGGVGKFEEGLASLKRPSRAFKSNQKSFTGPYLAIHMAKSIVSASNTPRENPLIRDFSISCHHIILPLLLLLLLLLLLILLLQ